MQVIHRILKTVFSHVCLFYYSDYVVFSCIDPVSCDFSWSIRRIDTLVPDSGSNPASIYDLFCFNHPDKGIILPRIFSWKSVSEDFSYLSSRIFCSYQWIFVRISNGSKGNGRSDRKQSDCKRRRQLSSDIYQ